MRYGMKRTITVIFAILLLIPVIILVMPKGGMASSGSEKAAEFFANSHSENTPHTKDDGSAFNICYVDIDPYPASGEMLYYLLMELNDEGWMNVPDFESLPFDPQDTDAKEFINYLADLGTGDYISFSREQNYYIGLEDIDQVKKGITKGIEDGQIDLILCLGTWPGELVISEMGVTEVPVMVYFSVDPVASGLSATQEYSGQPNVWCHTSSKVYRNQLSLYHDAYDFHRIGMVYYSESVAAVDMYRKAAEEMGVTVAERKIETVGPDESRDDYYKRLVDSYRELIEKEKIDAFLLSTDMIKDPDKIEPMISVFYDAGIPVFVQNGQFFVSGGALMLMSASDAKSQAPFAVDAMTRILSGEEAGSVYQEYIPSPYVSINLDAARKIGYEIPEELLRTSEKIYGGGSRN